MLVSVGICTWNRAALLQDALGSLSRATVPTGLAWEVLVVNNGSTDRTESVVTGFRDTLPIRCVVEPQLGLSNARNRCIDEAEGDYVLWTDDDVIVEKDWLKEHVRGFREFPAAAFFGGPVRPYVEEPLPHWLAVVWGQVQRAYAIRDLGDATVRLDPTTPELPFGANFSVRMVEQRRHRYDPRLGRKGTGLLGGEELAVLKAILRDGGEGWWLPGASVRHRVLKERQTTRYLKRYYRGQGRVLALEHRPEQRGWKPMPLGRPLWLWRQALTREAAYLRDRVLQDPERWIGSLARASTTWGLFAGWPAPWPRRSTHGRSGEDSPASDRALPPA